MPSWAVILVAPILIIAFISFVRAPVDPPPTAIPDAEFDALLRYVKQEVFLDEVSERLHLLPEGAGRTAAIATITALRLENLEALLYTRVIP